VHEAGQALRVEHLDPAVASACALVVASVGVGGQRRSRYRHCSALGVTPASHQWSGPADATQGVAERGDQGWPGDEPQSRDQPRGHHGDEDPAAKGGVRSAARTGAAVGVVGASAVVGTRSRIPTPWDFSSAISSRSANDRYRPAGSTDERSLPPPCRKRSPDACAVTQARSQESRDATLRPGKGSGCTGTRLEGRAVGTAPQTGEAGGKSPAAGVRPGPGGGCGHRRRRSVDSEFGSAVEERAARSPADRAVAPEVFAARGLWCCLEVFVPAFGQTPRCLGSLQRHLLTMG